MRRFVPLVLLLASCVSEEDLPAGVTRSDDGQGYCCPAGPADCHCRPVGGFVTDPTDCPTSGPCDSPSGAWHAGRDEHGCRVFTVEAPPWPESYGVCNPLADAGVYFVDAGSSLDAAIVDGAIVDAAIDAEAAADAGDAAR